MKIKQSKALIMLLILAFIMASLFSAFVLCGHECGSGEAECVICAVCEDLGKIRSLITAVVLCYGIIPCLCLTFVVRKCAEAACATLIQLKVKLSD